MKIKLLPSTFDRDGRVAPEQRLSCYLIDDCVAVDAGSLALSLSDAQRAGVRDVVLTHPHMDHVATLPVFIDDLFATLAEPVRVHATEEVLSVVERDIFNGSLYPRFSELTNGRGSRVLEYVPFRAGDEFAVAHLRFRAVEVNHAVPTVGLVIASAGAAVGFSSDTAATEEFWRTLNHLPRLDALLVEASFPDSMSALAQASGHLTPATLRHELRKLTHADVDILAVHIKPAYRDIVLRELAALGVPNLTAMEVGREYVWGEPA